MSIALQNEVDELKETVSDMENRLKAIEEALEEKSVKGKNESN